MSKLHNADIHMQFTTKEIKHIYSEKVNFCMHIHFYATIQAQFPSLQTHSAVFQLAYCSFALED